MHVQPARADWLWLFPATDCSQAPVESVNGFLKQRCRRSPTATSLFANIVLRPSHVVACATHSDFCLSPVEKGPLPGYVMTRRYWWRRANRATSRRLRDPKSAAHIESLTRERLRRDMGRLTYEGAPAKEYVTGKGSNSAMNPSSPCSDPPRELGTAVLHTVQSKPRTWKVERAAQ